VSAPWPDDAVVKPLRPPVTADAHWSVDHPHVVRVLGRVQTPTGVDLVLQRAAGDLDRRLTAGSLGERATTQLVLELCDALDHLHRQALVHGDLSPANVLLGPAGDARLADPDPTSGGTPGYAAPEVATTGASPQSDLYGVGVVGLACLGGTPSPLRAVLATAASIEPSDRPTSAAALARLVAGAVPGTTWLDRTRPNPTSPRSVEPRTRAFGPPPPARTLPRPRPKPPFWRHLIGPSPTTRRQNGRGWAR